MFVLFYTNHPDCHDAAGECRLKVQVEGITARLSSTEARQAHLAEQFQQILEQAQPESVWQQKQDQVFSCAICGVLWLDLMCRTHKLVIDAVNWAVLLQLHWIRHFDYACVSIKKASLQSSLTDPNDVGSAL